jgi:hypothetical protein
MREGCANGSAKIVQRAEDISRTRAWLLSQQEIIGKLPKVAQG